MELVARSENSKRVLQLVLSFLANESLDVQVKQLDGRVEGVIGMSLISLRDELSHNIGERAAVVQHNRWICGVFRRHWGYDGRLSPSREGGWQRCFSESPLWLCRDYLPISLAEFRVGTNFPQWGRGITIVGDSYWEVVRPKGGKGGPHHIGKYMPAQKGDIWRGGLALWGEASRDVLVCNSELWTVDRPIKCSSSGRCPVISCSGEPGGMVGV